MISNILIGLCSFIIGGVCGALMVTNALIKVDKMYKETTGNSFVKWVFDASATVKKHRIEEVYAAE